MTVTARKCTVRRAHISAFFLGGDLKRGGGATNLAAQGSFDEDSAAFQSEPFADAAHFRASLGYYEAVMNPARKAEPARLAEVSHTETLILYGIKDEVVGPKFPHRMALALPNHVGPFLIDSRHFIQWEQADTFNNAVVSFCSDLL